MTHVANGGLRLHYRPEDPSPEFETGPLDARARDFIGRCPCVLIGTSNGFGGTEVSPRGGRPGFVAIFDEGTIALPFSRAGNPEAVENMAVNPAMGALFFIPGASETLCLNGEGRISHDPETRRRLASGTGTPDGVLVMEVSRAYLYYGRALMRSDLWIPQPSRPPSELPSLLDIVKTQFAMADMVEQIDEHLHGRQSVLEAS